MSSVKYAVEIARAHAPYLAESLELFPDIPSRISPELTALECEEMFQQLPGAIGTVNEEMSVLRVLKRKIHLIIALSDLSSIWQWDQVTAMLSRFADVCMQRILYAAVVDQGIAPHSIDNPLPGFFVLAVGKYGALELNYSSDIDFNVFYDPEIVTLPDPNRAERTLIKLVQALIRGFEAVTEDGYIFRTDLRLRPDPRSNAVAVSTRTAERYYVSLGQNWERAAMIKARVCGGDNAAGQDFIDQVLSPFIWRKNLDYAAIEDILAMKRQIHARQSAPTINGFNLKLGSGGIREIEFFAQVQQLILGGREAELRVSRTLDALRLLAEKGFVEPADADVLAGHYATLRNWEHRAQMMRDEQTHLIPADPAQKLDFIRLCGFDTESEFDDSAQSIFSAVNDIFYNLFPDAGDLSSREGNLSFTGVEAGPQTLETLSRLGFRRGEDVWNEMASWLGGRIAATRSERAREMLTNLAPLIIETCADIGNADEAFFAFSGFFTKLRTGVSLLSMFQRQPERLKFLIHLIAASPIISENLSRKPEILDALADPGFMLEEDSILGERYAEEIANSEDFEAALNQMRRMVREDQFRVTASVLSNRVSLEASGRMLTHIADQTVGAMLSASVLEVERKFGPVGGFVGIIGLGKMGGQELSLNSDLDIMVVYQPEDGDTDAPRRYAKVTQRLINALSAFTEEGGLYEVDMALRPSGRSGPVAVSLDGFQSYYKSDAWTWEFMALSRGRIIAATDEEYYARLDDIMKSALNSQRQDLDMPGDIAEMLHRVRREKPPRHEFDIKNLHGGIRDVEFIAQRLCLESRQKFSQTEARSTRAMLNFAAEHDLLTKRAYLQLLDSIGFYQSFRQACGYTVGSLQKNKFGDSDFSKICDVMGLTQGQFKKQFQKHLNSTEAWVQKYLEI